MVRRLVTSVVVVVVGLAGAPAFAQAPGEVAPLALAPAPAPKDPSTALDLSLGFTVGGAAMLLLGATAHSSTTTWLGVGMMYFGPATGHWYAGEVGAGGLGLRALAVLGGTTAALLAFEDDGCDGPCSDNDSLITGLLIASAGTWLGSTIYDIATAPRAARSWNRAHGVALAPTVVRSGGRNLPGVALALRF